MKTISFTLLLMAFASAGLYAQTKVDKGIYKVNFSNTLHVPRYASYYLYKGGGPCNDSYEFKNDFPTLQCATDSDYMGNKVYDKMLRILLRTAQKRN